VDSVEPTSEYMNILQKIEDRFRKFGYLQIQIDQEDASGNKLQPILRITFPDYEKFQKMYEYKTQFFAKVLEDIRTHEFEYDKLFTKAFEVGTKASSDQNGEIYLSLKYQTNYRSHLAKYYKYSNKLGAYLGSLFYIEDIADGFLVFFQRKEDFIAHQVGRLNFPEILKWFKERGIGQDHPSIQILLKYLEEIKEELVKNEFYHD